MEITEIQKTWNVKINPTYAVLYRSYPKRSILTNSTKHKANTRRTAKQVANNKNLADNTQKGHLSKKATTRLKNSLSWLILQAKPKRIKNNSTGKHFTFRINLITLTLPFNQGKLSDNFIRRELLNVMLMNLKNRYNLNTYVWKAEAQANGNIHFHIVTDTYMPHEEIRMIWNRIITKKGLMKEYTDKMKNLSFEDYVNMIDNKGTKDIRLIKKNFEYNNSTGWCNPNSTDVHSIKGVQNLSAYLATYMSKKEKDKRKIVGRIWSSSVNISSKSKLIVSTVEHEGDTMLNELASKSEEIKYIMTKEDDPNEQKLVCTIFFYNPWKFLKSQQSMIKEAILEHIGRIRALQEERQPILELVPSIVQ